MPDARELPNDDVNRTIHDDPPEVNLRLKVKRLEAEVDFLRAHVSDLVDVMEVARLCSQAQTLSVGIIRDSLQKAIERYDDARP